MKKVIFFLVLIFSVSMLLNATDKMEGEWEFHQWRTDVKDGSQITLVFGRSQTIKDVPQFLYGCQITCGLVGTWEFKGMFLRITIMGSSSFYLIRVSETEWRGVGHITHYPAECRMYKI